MICIFIPTLTTGGAEKVASILANEWSTSERVTIVTFFNTPIFYDIALNIDVICLNFTPNRGKLLRSIDIIRGILSLRRVIKQLAPKFVLSFMNKYNAFCIASLMGTKIPVIISERGSPTEKLPRIRIITRDLLYPKAAGLICQTQIAKEFIASRLNIRHITVIQNPIQRILDPHQRKPQKIILSVGRFIESKCFDHLIESFSKLKLSDWKLILCGDGPMNESLKQIAMRLDIYDQVEFTGIVHDLRPYYKNAGIFAFSSMHEGYPNALAEAVVSGLPCVSYDCPTGPSELINNEKNGLLVPVGDKVALTKALERLAQDRSFAENLGAMASNLATELEPSRIANQYLTFCLQAADRARNT